jgi:hypothetical protein
MTIPTIKDLTDEAIRELAKQYNVSEEIMKQIINEYYENNQNKSKLTLNLDMKVEKFYNYLPDNQNEWFEKKKKKLKKKGDLK